MTSVRLPTLVETLYSSRLTCQQPSTRSTIPLSSTCLVLHLASMTQLCSGLCLTLTNAHRCQVCLWPVSYYLFQDWCAARFVTWTATVCTIHLATYQCDYKVYGVDRHQNTDDMQLYLSVDKWDLPAREGVLKLCIEAIYIWLSHTGLSLNMSNSEAIQFGAAKGRNVNDNLKSITIAGADIPLSSMLKSLVLVSSSIWDFPSTVKWQLCAKLATPIYMPYQTVANTGMQLSQLASRLLQLLVFRLFEFILDHLQKVKKVQNTLACIIAQQLKCNHITPILMILKELHWLPVI